MTLFGWHITHLSPHGTPSDAKINSKCPRESYIFLCGYFDEYKGKVTLLKSPLLSFFHSLYTMTFFGWHIIHQSPCGTQINSVCHQDKYKYELTVLQKQHKVCAAFRSMWLCLVPTNAPSNALHHTATLKTNPPNPLHRRTSRALLPHQDGHICDLPSGLQKMMTDQEAIKRIAKVQNPGKFCLL